MKRIVPIGVAASIVAGVIAIGSVAAERQPQSLPAAMDHSDVFPMPVAGNTAFGRHSDENACIGTEHMLNVLALDVEALGGEVLLLDDGLQQAFSDSWRTTVGLPSVKVTHVFAHVVPAPDGDAVVDVIEIDAKGCALSRTLLAIDDWLSILRPLQSVDV